MSKIIIFDCFGTLITPANDAGPNPYPLLGRDPKLLRRFLTENKSLRAFAMQLGKAELVPELYSMLEAQINGVGLYPDVPELLARLRETGWKIGLCSNLAMDFGPRVKELLPDMDAYIFSFEVGAKKPEREIYAAVCKVMSCDAQDVFFIGNSQKADFDGPAEFGMRSALIDRSTETPVLFKGWPDDAAARAIMKRMWNWHVANPFPVNLVGEIPPCSKCGRCIGSGVDRLCQENECPQKKPSP